MTIQIRCSNCNAMLSAPDTARGKKLRCGKFQAVISVPVAASSPPTTNEPAPDSGTSEEKLIRTSCPHCQKQIQFLTKPGATVRCESCQQP